LTIYLKADRIRFAGEWRRVWNLLMAGIEHAGTKNNAQERGRK